MTEKTVKLPRAISFEEIMAAIAAPTAPISLDPIEGPARPSVRLPRTEVFTLPTLAGPLPTKPL